MIRNNLGVNSKGTSSFILNSGATDNLIKDKEGEGEGSQ